MDVCSKLLQLNEIYSYEANDTICDVILKEFVDKIGDVFIFFDSQPACEKFEDLKDGCIYTSEYVDVFFEILKKHNYNMKKEIKSAMFYLGHLENPNHNKTIIRRLLNSPVIQDISFNGKNKFTISSEQYGIFVFELASYYFRLNSKMTDYINNNYLPNNCHYHTFFMSEVFNDFYAITSLCKCDFTGRYYHSYSLDKKSDNVIDLCYNAIVNKDSYYHIFDPKEVSVILNSDLEMELKLAIANTNQPVDRCRLLKIALYKQYLASIQQGDLSEKIYTKKLI